MESRNWISLLWMGALVLGACGSGEPSEFVNTPEEPAPGQSSEDGSEAVPSSSTGTWSTFEAGPLATRGEPSAVWTGSELIVIGGLAIEHYAALADGGAYSPTSGTWRSIASRPVRGRVSVAAWTGSEMFVLGRREGIELEPPDAAHLYNPVSDEWRAAPTRSLGGWPEAAWWTGDEVLVWHLGGGALFDPDRYTWRPIPPSTVPGTTTVGRATWVPESRVLAVQAAVAPAAGGPLVDVILLYDPTVNAWSRGPRLPAAVLGFVHAYGAATGTGVIYSPDPAGPILSYSATTSEWRQLPPLGVDRDRGTAYFSGVPLGDGRVAIRIGDADTPLVIAEPDGSWSYAIAPAGQPLPAPDTVSVWTGQELLMWGRPHNAKTGAGNGALRWRP